MNKPKWLQYVEYVPARLILSITKFIPYKISCGIGRLLGIVIYYIVPGLRKTAYEGLSIAFSNTYNKKEIKRIAKDSFRYLGQMTFEFIQLPKLKKNNKILEYLDFGDSLKVIKSLLDKEKGVIAVSAHIGNWEMMTAGTSMLGYPINVVVRLLDNPLLDRYVENFREMYGTKVIPKQEAAKLSFRILKQNEVVAYLIDQNWAIGGVFVPFFDKLAATVTGPALFSYKLNETPIMAAYSYRIAGGKHKVVFEELPTIKSENKEDYIKINTANFTKYFENVVREHPEQWLWVHPRWKKRPENEL